MTDDGIFIKDYREQYLGKVLSRKRHILLMSKNLVTYLSIFYLRKEGYIHITPK